MLKSMGRPCANSGSSPSSALLLPWIPAELRLSMRNARRSRIRKFLRRSLRDLGSFDTRGAAKLLSKNFQMAITPSAEKDTIGSRMRPNHLSPGGQTRVSSRSLLSQADRVEAHALGLDPARLADVIDALDQLHGDPRQSLAQTTPSTMEGQALTNSAVTAMRATATSKKTTHTPGCTVGRFLVGIFSIDT